MSSAMSNRIIAAAGIAAPLGPYSMAVACDGPGTWLHIAGKAGVASDGRSAGDGEGQTLLAWSYLVAVLQAAGMQMRHVVKVTTCLPRPADVPLLGPVRAAFLREARPASTLVIVQALASPQWLVEVEATAFLPAAA